ncbi:hypothetical protein PFMALIP_01614 [Plasmodium falciparum MaliPS096_E11]|uniref:Surface antigen n=1 Tax=Plasmodium falciparum MaliPS096_E11 TaxID=1036727 RepID=A0A024WTM3_PLAFA|nr:hypothetical protein PFMALIP_01614 [Plasmodium falciparum MaliPS096_E11]
MKMHYSEILFFSLSINILITSSYAHNKNKPYITPHTPTNTSRVLSEYDLYMSNCDNDDDMKSVKENFDRQTSQRFEEYEKRMIKKRKKCKEQCEKDIKQIILKDKIDKSLEEKIEKGCLRCGCGLGGVAACVGIFGSLGTYGWEIGATATAMELATKKGIQAGIDTVITKIKTTNTFKSLWTVELSDFINPSNYSTSNGLFDAVKAAMASIEKSCISESVDRACNGILTDSDTWLGPFAEAGKNATALTTETVQKAQLLKVTDTSIHLYSAIGYSVTAILIIVLVMVIIYLILRYRRKKKTKLLNQ